MAFFLMAPESHTESPTLNKAPPKTASSGKRQAGKRQAGKKQAGKKQPAIQKPPSPKTARGANSSPKNKPPAKKTPRRKAKNSENCRGGILQTGGVDFKEDLTEQSGLSYILRHYSYRFPSYRFPEEELAMDSERQNELIIEYRRTKDPEILERIMASLAKRLQSYVSAALRETPYFSDAAAKDDLLQHAFLKALNDIQSRYTPGKGKKLFAYMKSYMIGELTAELYDQKSLINKKNKKKKSDRPGGETAEGPNSKRGGQIKIISLDETADNGEGKRGNFFAETLTDPNQLPLEEQIFYESHIGALFDKLRECPGLTELEGKILEGYKSGFEEKDWERFRRENSLSRSQLKSKIGMLFRKIRHYMSDEDVGAFFD